MISNDFSARASLDLSEPDPFGPSQSRPDPEGDVSSALADVMGTLGDTALGDFLGASEAASSAASGGAWIVFECWMRDGRPEPLKPGDRNHPVWRELAPLVEARDAGAASGFVSRDHLALLMEAGPERPARLLAMADGDIMQGLRALAPLEPVTASELRVLKQLICGMGLSEAARADGVSHETKRSQYKSLSRKLAARSQNELTNRVLTHLLVAPAAGGAGVEASAPDEVFIDLVREFIPSARCFQLRGARGARHRFVDIGPVSGRPVVFVHPQILPDIRPSEIALLHDHGLRLIVPLRNGALSAGGVSLGVAAHLDHACEGIDLARTHFSGAAIDLILCISGCAYGVEYARRWPERVRSLAFLGACVRPITDRRAAGRLRAGLFALAARNWGLFSGALAFYGRRLRHPDTFGRMILDHYRPSPADFAVVLAEHDSPNGIERGRKCFSASIESITHDFHHQMILRWDHFPKGRFPAVFIHGSRDLIHPVEGVRELARMLDAPVREIPHAGQLLYHEHFEPALAAYSAFLDGVADRP